MSKAIFISDLHLGVIKDAVPNREELLIELLIKWSKLNGSDRISHLVLVGDVFEFWMEYKDFIPKKHFAFMVALKDLAKSGTEVFYLAGNHDFHLESFFKDNLGVETYNKLLLEIQNKRVYFQHGDGLNNDDWGYKFARKIITHPLNIFLFKLLHPDWGMKLARFVSKSSRDSEHPDDNYMQKYQESAKVLAKENKAEIVVVGHTHLALVKELDDKIIFVNTGQWLFELNYIEMIDGVCQIKKISI